MTSDEHTGACESGDIGVWGGSSTQRGRLYSTLKWRTAGSRVRLFTWLKEEAARMSACLSRLTSPVRLWRAHPNAYKKGRDRPRQ